MALADIAVAAFLGFVSLACLFLAVKMLRSAAGYFGLTRQMFGDDAEPVDVAEATAGQLAVSGTARAASGGTIPLPFSPGEAVVAIGSTLKRSHSENGTSITTDERATETVPFVVEDETGSIRVEPDDSIQHGENERFSPDEVDQSSLSAWLDRTDVDSKSSVGYKQQAVTPGDEVYVYGTVVDGDDADGDSRRIVDEGDLIVSTEGREQIGGSGVVGGVFALFFGGLLLFFAVSALLIALVFLFA